MLQLQCDKCGEELTQPGALLFSPPSGDGWLVEKLHLCQSCWRDVVSLVHPTNGDAAASDQLRNS